LISDKEKLKTKMENNMKFKYIFITPTFILLGFAQAFAQLDRAFVATTGTDSATCGASGAPCRNFNAALARTNNGGEITALDSGIYDNSNTNTVITISVTLTAAPGVHAELSNTNNTTDRILINAQTSDRVVLRNLYLSRQAGPGGGLKSGVKIDRVGVLHIENCVIEGFNEGISFDLNNAAQVFIQNTSVRNNIADGILFFTNTGLIKASIENSHFDNNGTGGAFNGVNILRKSRVTVRGSTASGNGSAGFAVSGGDLNLDNCEASNNRDGVVTAGDNLDTGTAVVSNSVITNNSRNGFYQLGGTFNSLGNNVVRRNGTNSNGTINTISGT
jgi:hypothetical protein